MRRDVVLGNAVKDELDGPIPGRRYLDKASITLLLNLDLDHSLQSLRQRLCAKRTLRCPRMHVESHMLVRIRQSHLASKKWHQGLTDRQYIR